MDQTVNINFNISGNATDTTINIAKNIANVSKEAKEAASSLKDVGERLFAFQQITQTIKSFRDVFSSVIQPGVALNSSLADLSAIAGITGDKLKEIEGYARDTAKTFGTDAASSVESYKLLLSQLSPELGNYPTALRAMGDNIATLSKTMGGDATAAAEVLTTAMNQYGVSLDDPMEAS